MPLSAVLMPKRGGLAGEPTQAWAGVPPWAVGILRGMKKPVLQLQQEAALLRFRVVNHVSDRLGAGLSLAQALRDAAARPWPDESGKYFASRTIEDWWYAHKQGGFAGLMDAPRRDRGSSRVVDEQTGRWIIEQISQHPEMYVSVLYSHWLSQGRRLPSLRSVYRYLMRHGYDKARLRAGRLDTGPTHPFAAAQPNDLWMVDFSPGPVIKTGGGSQRTHLCVMVDDCSRLIPFGGYYPQADTEAFHHALQEAIQRRGLPRMLYTDNGKPFVGHHTRIVCAGLGIRLLHAKPYHAWSKGKVERLIQTIQSGFEATLRLPGNNATSLDDLNAKLSHWIQATYHQRVHSATGMSPEARFQQAAATLRRLAPDEDIERIFHTRVDRTVRKDGTIRLGGRLYEVPLSLRALAIELRFNPFTRQRMEVWHQGKFISLAKPANLNLNHETGGAHAYEN